MEVDHQDDDSGKRTDSPTNIRAGQHAKKIREQHLTDTGFEVGMSLGDVARQFGYKSANDGTYIKTTDKGVDVIEPRGGAWEHRPAGDPLNFTTGKDARTLFDHLEFINADYHDGRMLSKFVRRSLGLVENLSDELGSAVLTYMHRHNCTYIEALRETTRQNPELWEQHKQQQVVTLID